MKNLQVGDLIKWCPKWEVNPSIGVVTKVFRRGAKVLWSSGLHRTLKKDYFKYAVKV